MSTSSEVAPEPSTESARSDFEVFTSLWSTICAAYEGTNIPRTIARLLHMYQPEDGILVYERLLRTLYLLLENFDINSFCLLVSMIPPPKGVSNATTEKIFFQATGCYRLNTPIFRFNNASHIPAALESSICYKFTKKSVAATTPLSLCNPAASSSIKESMDQSSLPPKKRKTSLTIEPQVMLPELHVFRGFPSQEISNTRGHIQNINHFVNPSNHASLGLQVYHNFESGQKDTLTSMTVPCNDYGLKFVQSPSLLQKDTQQSSLAYRDFVIKTMGNKCVMLPVAKAYDTSHSEMPAYDLNIKNCQEFGKCMDNNTETVNDEVQNNIKKESSQHDKLVKNRTDLCLQSPLNNVMNIAIDKNEIKDSSFEKIVPHHCTSECEESEKMKYKAIQEDIFKMDVVRNDDNEQFIFEKQKIEIDNLIVHDNLKNSLWNFLKRIENGKSCNVPVLPKTRSLTEAKWSATSCQKVTENVKNDKNFTVKNISSKVKEVLKKSTRRKKSEPPTRPKSERVAQKCSIAQNSLNESVCTVKQIKSVSDKNVDLQNDLSVYTNSENNLVNCVQQSNPIFELAIYKKQYCDALLSIQRAKAVANSLAISSMNNTGVYDPYYFNYLQRQHQLQQQSQHFLMDPRLAMQRNAFQPRFANTVPNQNNLLTSQNSWKFQSYEQFGIPQHAHAMCSSINTSNVRYAAQNTVVPNTQFQEMNHFKLETPNMKRSKLENTVVQLKETDDIFLKK